MKKLLHYLKSNKGSGVVMVMLAMLFLTAFGTLALYLSYTQVKLGVSERTGMETEVDAYTCMDEVRAGVQQLVSDAIAETYQAVMPTYSKENENITQSFKDEFNLLVVDCEYKIKDSDTSGYKLFTDNATKYDITTLEKMVRENRGYDVDIYSGDIGKGFGTAGKGEIVKTDADGKVVTSMLQVPNAYTLKDITLEFTGKDGYTTSVTTDIVITCPDIGYLLTQYALKGIPNFAMVATDTIYQVIGDGAATTSNVTVNGDVYAGNVELDGDSTFKVVNYSTFICKNDINVKQGKNVSVTQTLQNKVTKYNFSSDPRAYFDNTTTVWAGRIKIGSLTSAIFAGDTYVQNDLVFSGNNSNVKLGSYITKSKRGGSYYGFGSSTTDSDISSSIISNRTGNKLYINELGSLTLAGYTFISDYVSETDTTRTAVYSDDSDTSNDVRMGESVSGKYNQMVYYANAEKVVYFEYKLNSDGDKINSTGHYISGTYPNVTYYYFDDSGNKVSCTDSEYAPQVDTYTIEQEKMAVIQKADYANIIRFGLVGESYKWVDGKYVIDTSAGDNGYSTSLIDDSVPDSSYTLYHKTFADYHAHLAAVYETAGDSQYVVHFLLSFKDPDDSNQYFQAQFDYNSMEMKNELLNTINLIGLNSGIANTASASIYKDDNFNEITSALSQTIEEIKKNAEFIQEIFENYCTTLSNEPSDDPSDDTPFDTYVKKEKINDFSTDPTSTVVKEFKNSKGEVVAVIVKGNYTFTSDSSDSICLIIATGDITVTDDFSGLILTDGSIYIKSDADFSQNYEKVISAFQATGDAGTVKDFFKRNITKDYTLEDGETVENIAAYDIDAMVYYDNWTE